MTLPVGWGDPSADPVADIRAFRHRRSLDQDPRGFALASVDDLVRRADCSCPRLPWSPHRHRFDLGSGS